MQSVRAWCKGTYINEVRTQRHPLHSRYLELSNMMQSRAQHTRYVLPLALKDGLLH